MPTIESKFPSYMGYKINGKTWYALRWDRTVQNVEQIDPALAGESVLVSQTLPV